MVEQETRRGLIVLGAAFGTGLLAPPVLAREEGEKKEVGAVEDLMREHGVLRRVLLVYAETAPRLRDKPESVDAGALNKAARLFRDFGEEYHEKKLEEAYIFPRVRKAGGEAAAMVETLLEQHRRGREITQFVIGATAGGRLATANAAALARAFDDFARMYENHAAREDTVLFPAWKKALRAKELSELGERFEDIERQQFGGDGFNIAVRQVAEIEAALGLADLAKFTPPPLKT